MGMMQVFSQIIKIKRESRQNEIVEPLKLILKMGGRGGGGQLIIWGMVSDLVFALTLIFRGFIHLPYFNHKQVNTINKLAYTQLFKYILFFYFHFCVCLYYVPWVSMFTSVLTKAFSSIAQDLSILNFVKLSFSGIFNLLASPQLLVKSSPGRSKGILPMWESFTQ